MMDRQKTGHSPEFQEFVQEVETALIKASAEARRIAEQTGTKFIVLETFQPQTREAHTGDATAMRYEEEQPGG